MEALITSYGIDFKSFNDLLVKHRAVIAGSSVLSVYLNNPFVANDIDVWIPCSKSLNEFLPIYKELFKYFTKIGYDDEEINKNEVTNEKHRYSNLPNGRAQIVKVIEFYNSEDKKIQFVFVNTLPINFIKETFDLSICMTWYEPKTMTIKTHDEFYTKKMKMYINYDKDIKDLHPKNKARIEKYQSRGFELIPKPLPILISQDERVFTKSFNIEANDVILLGDVNICDYIKESRKNIILKISKSYYAYNRDDLKKELIKFSLREYALTPLKQAISNSSIDLFMFDDYSIYEIRVTGKKTSDNKHSLHSVKPLSVKQFENIYNENGIKDGIVKRFYRTGELKSEVTYCDNIKNGIKKKYGILGNVIEEIPYDDNKINGIRKFFIDGKLAKTCNYLDGKLNGKVIVYYPKDESMVNLEIDYVDNKPHGDYIKYDKEGNISVKINYIEGVAQIPEIKI
jgi:antitoxin component YwqK of YwqJK toxin-antitoxin module